MNFKNFCVHANAVSCFENCHFLSHRPPARPRGILCLDTIGSPYRGILCVEKTGSVAPELQEWLGTRSKPVKSTNGPFYWLTRKRAPPCCWTLSGDLCKNRLPAGIRGWAGTATGGHIHVVHISHTHPPKELIQALRKYLLGKRDGSRTGTQRVIILCTSRAVLSRSCVDGEAREHR